MLKKQLRKAQDTIKCMDTEQVEFLIDGINQSKIDGINQSKNETINYQEALLHLFKLAAESDDTSADGYSFGHWFAKGLGGIVGVISTYVMLPIAEESFNAFTALLRWDGAAANTMANILTTLSVAAAAALMAYTSATTFDQFYASCKNLPGILKKLPSVCNTIREHSCDKDSFKAILEQALTFVSLVFAVTSSVPSIDLTMSHAQLPEFLLDSLLACVILSAVCKNFWSLEQFRSRFFNYSDINNDQLSLCKKIDKMIAQLDNFSPPYINALYQEYCDKQNFIVSSLEQKVSSDSEITPLNADADKEKNYTTLDIANPFQ
jgi:hypothetical protein